MGGRSYTANEKLRPYDQFKSSSCVEEIAFGPKTLPKSTQEIQKLVEDYGLTDEFELRPIEKVVRDPKSIPPEKTQTDCQKAYYQENTQIPDIHFGNKDLNITYLPPANGLSKKVSIYDFAERRNEVEVLVPLGTQFKVVKFIKGDSPGDESYLILEEIP